MEFRIYSLCICLSLCTAGLAQSVAINMDGTAPDSSASINDLSGYDASEEHIGVITQELKEIRPHMLSTYEKEGIEYFQVDNSAMTYMLINAVKEQQAQIAAIAKKKQYRQFYV